MLSFLRHLFLPHLTNNFRARALHTQVFGVYIVLFLLLGLSFRMLSDVNPKVLSFATDIFTDQLVTFTNQKRVENGLAPLKYNAELSQAAAKKAADMFAKDYWAHVAPDGKTPWDFINSVGYIYTVAGENLAKNFNDSEGVVDAWMNSPSHRENLLRSQYEDVGFAVVNGRLNGEDTTLVVQMFGKRLSTVPTSENQAGTPLVGGAQAVEQAPQVLAQASPQLQAAPVEVGIGESTQNQPFINLAHFPRQLSVLFFATLSVLLLVDGLYVWKNKIVRVGGKVSAHLLFLLAITGIVTILSIGSIL